MRSQRQSAKRISYREITSDDSSTDKDSDTSASTPPPPTPQRRSKRTRSTKPPSTRPSQTSSRPTRSRHQERISYKEDSSDDGLDGLESAELEEQEQPAPKRRRTAVAQAISQVSRRISRRTKTAHVPSGKQSGFRPAVKRTPTPVANIPAPIDTDGVIPAWSTLPYEILRQIFTYASYPFHDENFAPTKSIAWLLDTARVCRSFKEPALTALYNSPPLLSLDKPHALLQLLKEPQDAHSLNYNAKVKRVELDLRSSLAYTAPGWGSKFELGELIPHVPQLREVHITNILGKPGFRRTENQIRWKYPDSLFESLRANVRRLKEWHWNGHMCSKDQDFTWMKSIHLMDSFARLEHVGFTSFDPPESRTDEAPNNTLEEQLAAAISALPELKGLHFEQSDIVNEVLLPLLPKNLESLTFINCGDLTSEALEAFLITHGARVKELVLNHNQALDLFFLQTLRTSCPQLEVLKMDLNYYNSHIAHHDSDPRYDILLGENEVPTWPSSLQVIELIHLRQWTSSAAETFFGSLIDSAADLPHLRKLTLKAILNIGWRDRAGFRDQWIRRFQKVFMRKSAPPDPHLASLKAFRLWKESAGNGEPNVAAESKSGLEDILMSDSDSDAPLLQRKRKRTDTDVDGDGDDDQPSWGKRRLRPRRTPPQDTQDDDDAASPGAGSGDESDAPTQAEEKFIQGMCEVVDIRIDNQRPRESQFNENDFLDEEVSGDEDWNGEDEEQEGGFVRRWGKGYAW